MAWLAVVDTTAKTCIEKVTDLLPSLYRCMKDPATGELKINSLQAVIQLIVNIIELMLTLASFIAVGMIIYAGFMYITSDGDPSGTKKAKDTIFNTLVGLVIVLAAFGIVRYVGGLIK